jgi:hypothetical protein
MSALNVRISLLRVVARGGRRAAGRTRLAAAALLAGLSCLALPAASPTEQQVKAVFVFNFAHFVEWPPGTFAAPTQPFVIGLLGGELLAAHLDEAVRDERVGGRPLQVRRYRSVDEIGACQILFIDESQGEQLTRALERVDRHGTLTVSDLDGASRRGVMIQLANEKNRIRLLINLDSAQAAGLTISSNLLRPAEIVSTAH